MIIYEEGIKKKKRLHCIYQSLSDICCHDGDSSVRHFNGDRECEFVIGVSERSNSGKNRRKLSGRNIITDPGRRKFYRGNALRWFWFMYSYSERFGEYENHFSSINNRRTAKIYKDAPGNCQKSWKKHYINLVARD